MGGTLTKIRPETSLLDRQMEVLQSQMQTMTTMYQEVKSVSAKVFEVEETLAKVADQTTLSPQSLYLICEKVREKAIEITKPLNIQDDKKFRETCGKMQRNIWSRIKKIYGVPRYIFIRQVDFKDAMETIEAMDLSDFI